MKNVHVLVIDPQIDFCSPKGALFVPGAVEDMQRFSSMLERIQGKVADIHCTLDCHHKMDVAHPSWWRDSNGRSPDPFTIISASDVRDGVWTPTIPQLRQRMIDYTSALETSGRYPLCIWPPHCLIGTEGNNVVPQLQNVFYDWETYKGATVNFVSKGSNPFTEHYGALRAEVPDPSDFSTQTNTQLVEVLENADIIAIAGEAGSHCLANTVRDIANEFQDPDTIKKLVLLTDATSAVTGFEQLQTDFITEMKARGMQLSTTVDFLV